MNVNNDCENETLSRSEDDMEYTSVSTSESASHSETDSLNYEEIAKQIEKNLMENEENSDMDLSTLENGHQAKKPGQPLKASKEMCEEVQDKAIKRDHGLNKKNMPELNPNFMSPNEIVPDLTDSSESEKEEGEC